MSTKEPRDFSNPGAKFVEVTPDRERKDRDRAALPSGLSASWQRSPDELDPSLIPPEKRKMLEETQKREQERRALDQSRAPVPAFVRPGTLQPVLESKRYFMIPALLMATFKKFLAGQDEISVNFTKEQAHLFLEVLGALKTPSNMSDAKVIIKLSDQLEEWTKGQ